MTQKMKRNMLFVLTCALISSCPFTAYAKESTDAFVNSFLDAIEKNEESVATSRNLIDSKKNILFQNAEFPSGIVDASKNLTLSGKIVSDSKIKTIEFIITDKYENTTYEEYIVKPDKTSYSIPTNIMSKLKIEDLASGCYKLSIIAENADGDRELLLNERFQLTGVTSELTSNVKLSQTTIYEGNGSYVTGTIKSNYNITKVTVEIVDTEYKKTERPNKKNYTISAAIDEAMRFDKLEVGIYVLKVTATDASGNTVVQKINVKIKSAENARIYYSITGVLQKTRSDCAFASMATCELYYSENGEGVFGNLLASARDPYEALKKKNGNSSYGNWYLINYKKVYSTSLTTLYNALKKGPVIVHKDMNPGSHYSVVYGYKGNNGKLSASNFLLYEVTNGARMDLYTWLHSYSSYNINGPGTFDHMVIRK